LRLTKGNLKQSVIADALGLTQQDYSDIELGKRKIDIAIITKVCDYFSIDLIEFYSGIGTISSNNSDLSEGGDSEALLFLKETFQLAMKAQEETINAKNETIEILKIVLKRSSGEAF